MQQLTAMFLLCLVAALFLWLGTRFHFFRLKKLPEEHPILCFPIWGFVGYLFTFFALAPLTIRLAAPTLKDLLWHSPPLLLTTLQLLAFFWTTAFLTFYSLIQRRETLKSIWLHKARRNFSSLLEDFGLGILAWVIAFPAVAAFGELVDLLTYLITGKTGIDQLAIQYLKQVKDSPSLLSIALITIIFAAPILEEIAFRGFLYTFMREKWGPFWGMFCSSLLFAAFHFSPEQGVSNIPLIATLFVFALFLAFVYERQRSLIAPIALHMTFNSISVMRILLFSN